MENKIRLGEYLIEKKIISQSQLNDVLEIQKKSHERLGTILLANLMVPRRDLFKALSELWSLPYVELKNVIVPSKFEKLPIQYAVKFQSVIINKSDKILEIAVADYPTDEFKQILSNLFPSYEKKFFVTTNWDIHEFIRNNYKNFVLNQATFGLVKFDAERSAFTVFTNLQFFVLLLFVFYIIINLLFFPIITIITVNFFVSIVFLVSVLFKFVVSMVGLNSQHIILTTDNEVAELKDGDLPLYTILVPVYHEANIVHQVMQNVAVMDYPPEKLEILILIEEDDNDTLNAAKKANPPDYVRFVIIPNGLPKTKPKACNVGLMYARGEYLVIYDAEDRPDPDQLKKAIVSFQKGSEKLICVQAALNYFNWNDNWLTRMFTLEYSYWFDYMLPGLQRLHLPIPLGGTSNHFRVDRLIELGGWDPFNVTEDADLGIRASSKGYTVGVINSTTYEEANMRYYNWIRQRSRWVKGYMQTVLVHARNPFKFVSHVGFWQAMGFSLLIGGTPVGNLLTLPSLLLFMFWWITRYYEIGFYFPSYVLYLGLFNLLIGNSIGIYLTMMSVFKRQQYKLILFSLLNPLYWTMHSIASYKALWQLFSKPFFWEKTNHGLSPHVTIAVDSKVQTTESFRGASV